MSATNFRGGRKLSPKPSALRRNTPYAQTFGLCSGDFALPGANSRKCEFIQSEKTGLYLSMPPRGRAHRWRCCLRLHFRTDVQHCRGDFTKQSPLRLSESDSRRLPGYGHRFTDSRPIMAAHKKCGGRLSAKRKEKRL